MTGRPVRIEPLGDEKLLIEIDEQLLVVQASCPHRNGRLRFGRIDARTMRITCPLHGATFDLTTGSRIGGPECGALHVERVGRRPEPGDTGTRGA